jgi:GDSL-like Lipase/Acylhydrolase family
MKRLTLFSKGNVDIHDSLHSCRIGGVLQWNGINDALRESWPATSARVRHETWTRSDATLAADGTVPAALTARDMPLGSYTLKSQFSNAVFTIEADAILLSIQADITTKLARHRTEGYLFYPNEISTWQDADKAWFRSEFEMLGLLDVEESMSNLGTMIEKLRQTRDVPVLVYNLSSVMPGDATHCHMGLGETYPVRIRRFNQALIDLSAATGISIVDVDTIIARHGADRLKLDTVHLTPEGYRRVAEEVVRVLDDLGVLDS